jgi:molybdate/tungstate transport system substrate-binding protein
MPERAYRRSEQRDLMNPRNVKILAVLIVLTIAIASVAAYLLLQPEKKVVLKVFTAGSLSQPFSDMAGQDMKAKFEKAHPNVDVQVTSGGSADMIRRITDLNQTCDVLAVADATLIPKNMINATKSTADFSIQFARNSMIIAYTNHSAHREIINATNWFDVLRMPDVKFGFSNPNDDPAGYRAQMVMKYAELYYNDSTIYHDLVLNNTNMIGVTHDVVNDTYMIKVPSDLTVTNTSKLMVRSAEVDLTSALELGSIDYLFIYESIASMHAASGEKILHLPMKINLNSTAYASFYAKVSVTQFADSTNASKVVKVKGSPIVYGVTIPTNSLNPALALEFIKMLLGPDGQATMNAAGQVPITPAYAGYWKSKVPEGLQSYVD